MLPRFRQFCLIFALLAPLTIPTPGLDWHSIGGHRLASLTVSPSGKTGFTEIPPATTGISFTNYLSEERSLTNQIFLNGSGVAAGDIDGDGLCDLYFCGLDSANVLYRNLGNWHFEDITATAGVACTGQASTGAVLADVDGDGSLDLIVNGIDHGTRLFLNDGKGKFHEVTGGSGLRSRAGSMSLALADIDGDGFLDLYVVNYRSDTLRDMPDLRFKIGTTNRISKLLTVNGQSVAAPSLEGRYSLDNNSSVLENGEADTLFRNLGGGHFEPVSWTNGAFLDEKGAPIPTPYDWGLSAMFHDLNGDGAPDLYVCNDFQSPDRIWLNDGHGKFRAIAREALQHISLFSMGVDFADIDRDGYDDFFVADMLSREHAHRQVQVMDPRAFAQARRPSAARPQVSHNTLFRNRGNGTYAEIAQFSGVDASDWSWCPVFLDVDLDGYEDLLLSTGHARDFQNADVARQIEEEKRRQTLSPVEQLRLRSRFPRVDTPNAAFRNRGDLTFADVSAAWGFDSHRISHGIALADLDNDGDLDVIINTLNNGPLLYRNDSSKPRLSVKLNGQPPNTKGVGARVRVTAPGMPVQTKEVQCGGRYLSSDDFSKTFAARRETDLLTVEVFWRSGSHTVVSNVPVNHVIELNESVSERVLTPLASPKKPFFEDLSNLLKHEHKDEPFDDFERQPLLPRKLSELGPGVTWFDFNGDGWEDLFVGTGKGGNLAAFRNDGKGGFIHQRSKIFEAPASRDVTTILGWRSSSNSAVLLQGLSTYEENDTNVLTFGELSLVTAAAHEFALPCTGSVGPMALADIDSDGDLDLFVGGRVIPGRYPEAASSILLRNENGEFHIDAEVSRAFASIGMVSGAIFTDLTGDGWPDLVLACEWGPIHIFRNDAGNLRPWDLPVQWQKSTSPKHAPTLLSQMTGRWNSVASGDFDGDGQLDLVVGNWGRNSFQEHFIREPMHLYFGNTDASSTLGLIESHYDPGLKKFVPARDWSALNAVFPILRERFPNFTSFSDTGISEVLQSGLPQMRDLSANTFDSVVLLNRTNYFEVHPLPPEAQFAPVFGISVGDLDGDGNQDIFLAQNFRGTRDGESPQDAGCGIWLRGDGKGAFAVVSPQESGLTVYGEGRGAALCDFDHDGRLDLVVGQNRGATKLYHNTLAKPGIRVRLQGPAENLQAAGAVVRTVAHDGMMGAAQEVHIGGGYWSQDATDLLFGFVEEPAAIMIRWPGGETELVNLPPPSRVFLRKIPGK